MTSKPALEGAEPWQAHLQTLHRRFFDEADDRCLLWINPAQGDPFADDPVVDDRRVRVPLLHANFNIELAPYLVQLDLGKSRDADVFKRSVGMAWGAWEFDSLRSFSGQPIAGWVVTDNTAPSLAQHWASNCHIHFVGGHQQLLRFHDPSVREWLWPTLTPQQQQTLLGNANSIVAVDRQQELMWHAALSIAGEAQELSEKNPQRYVGKLQLASSQWHQLGDHAVIHRAWLNCCTADSNFRHDLAANGNGLGEIFASLAHATAYGLSDAPDRELFASHALKLGSRFHESRKMDEVWIRTRAGEYYGAACEEVSGHRTDDLEIYLRSK